MTKVQSFINQKEVLPPIKEGDYLSEICRYENIYDSTLKRNGCLGECDPERAYRELVHLLRKYDGEVDGPQTYYNFCTELNEYFLNVWGTAYTLFDMPNDERSSAEFISIPYYPFEYCGKKHNFIINEKAPFFEVKNVFSILTRFQNWCLDTSKLDAEMMEMKAYEFGHCFNGLQEAYDCFIKHLMKYKGKRQ